MSQLQGPERDVSGMASMQLQGLQVRLGPELRAMYPVVVNMGISGGLELSGPADPAKLRLNGVVHLESGEVFPSHSPGTFQPISLPDLLETPSCVPASVVLHASCCKILFHLRVMLTHFAVVSPAASHRSSCARF